MVSLQLGHYYLLMPASFENEFSVNIHCPYYVLLPNYKDKCPWFNQVATIQNEVPETVGYPQEEV